MSVQDYLAELDADYQEVKKSGGRRNVPDGRYAVMAKSGAVQEYKNKPGHYLFWDLVVMDGQQKNRHIFKYNNITKESMGFLYDDLEKAGIKMESISELPELCETEFPGRLLEVAVVTKGEYQNVYINKYAGMGSLEDLPKGGGGGEQPAGADEFTVVDEGEDLPF